MIAKDSQPFSIVEDTGFLRLLSNYVCPLILSHRETPCYLTQDCEHIWHFIEQILIKGMELFIPQCKVHSKQDPIWYNSEIRHCINRLRTLRRRYKRHPTDHVSSIITSIEDTLKDKIKAAKQNYESHLINSYAL